MSGNCDATTCGQCNDGYKGDRCEICIFGYYQLSGQNGVVDPITGEGVICASNSIVHN